jgi:hypothetical protein
MRIGNKSSERIPAPICRMEVLEVKTWNYQIARKIDGR